MSSPAPSQPLHELLNAALAEDVSPAQLAQAEALLRESPAARDEFLALCQLETDLHFQSHADLAAKQALSRLPPALAEASDRSESSESSRGQRLAERWRKWPKAYRLAIELATAASLLVGTGAYIGPSLWATPIAAERAPQTVARLTESRDAAWLEDEKFAVGHSFIEGDSVYLTQGSARISMASGAEMVLQAPCFVTLSTMDRVRLEEGAITTQVAEWGRGFKILTDALQVEDLGTKFAVAVADTGATETHVLSGQVRIQPLDNAPRDRRTMLLSNGEAMRVESERNVTRWMDANRTLYDVDMGTDSPYKPIAIHNTGLGLAPGDEDPNWRITAGVRCADYSEPKFAVVNEADERYLPNDPERSQWISIHNPVRPGAPPNSEYTFETTFDLTGYELSTVTVTAQLLADNGVKEIRINGEHLPLTEWSLNERNQFFNRFVVAKIDRSLVPGVNRVEFVVWNGVDRAQPGAANPLSLRVEWQAFGRPEKGPPQRVSTIHN